MLSTNAPIVLGAILGTLVIFALVLVIVFRKRVKDEGALDEAMPTRRRVRTKAVETKPSRGRKKAAVEEELEEETEESFLFDSDEVTIVPQGVRNLTQTSAPWNFSVQDKNRFEPVASPALSEEVAAPQLEEPEPPVIISEEVTPPAPPMTRRARRAIDWD